MEFIKRIFRGYPKPSRFNSSYDKAAQENMVKFLNQDLPEMRKLLNKAEKAVRSYNGNRDSLNVGWAHSGIHELTNEIKDKLKRLQRVKIQ